MSSERIVLNRQSSVAELIPKIWMLWNQYKFLIITIRFGRDRSLEQNALWFAMYQRISQVLGTGTAEDISYWRAYCKLRLGVPIAKAYDAEFRAMWDVVVLANPVMHTWEAQMQLMQSSSFGADGFPVTRNFKRKPGVEYTESINRHFAEQGVFFGDLLDKQK